MNQRWLKIATLCACSCLACPAGERSEATTAAKVATQDPAPKPAPEPTTNAPHASAAELLASALLELSRQPTRLGEQPEQAHTALALGERFELHRYSEGMGESERVGFSLRPKQTEVVAVDLAKALALEAAAHEQVPITDRNRERLANAGKTPFEWKGLQLEIELAEREHGLGLAGWVVTDVLVLPAVPEPPSAERITITPEEAGAAGLPKLGFSLDTTGTGMTGERLSDGIYLHLSGPPGGPMLLRISPATPAAKFAEVVGGGQPVDAELVEQRVELLGTPRRAVTWITGEDLARTSWCAILLSAFDATPEDPALLIEIGVGHQGDAVSCKTAVEHPSMKMLLDSLKLTMP